MELLIVLWCRKETLKPVDMNDDLLQNPQLPPRKYKGAEEAKTPVSQEEANTREVCVFVCVCVCVCVCACVRACVCACVRVCLP